MRYALSSMLVLIVLGLQPRTPVAAQSLSPAPAEALDAETHALSERSYYQLEQQVRRAIRREASAADLIARGQAVEAMAQLYVSILQDPRYATSPELQKLRARMWGRLTMIERTLKRQMTGWQRELKGQGDAANQPESITAEQRLAAARALSTSLDLLSTTQGGPSRLLYNPPARSGSALGGAAQLDYGQTLVELIERTITPQFWDVNGGPGVIMYYPPLFALVVSATEEVHEKIGGVVGGLR